VVDDPSRPVTQRIVRRAREAGARVVVISDLGGNRGTGADLTVDGSLRPGRPARRTDLNGPRFAVLNPDLAQAGECPVSRREPRVVIALGGGSHVRSLGTQLARRLAGRAPGVRVALASGFSGRGLRPTLPASCEWLEPGGLFTALRTAAVAVVAGGLTLYEACALGTPVVALAVTPAQRVATRAFARAGAAIDVSATVRAPALALAAEATLALLSDRDRAAALGHRGGRLVDGDGAARVARRIRKLLVQGPDARRPHAA
jgi:spore coat polysaccharide biosynthesis predicted glycosyltransferase SpsG